jgi:hypothetical protein
MSKSAAGREKRSARLWHGEAGAGSTANIRAKRIRRTTPSTRSTRDGIARRAALSHRNLRNKLNRRSRGRRRGRYRKGRYRKGR